MALGPRLAILFQPKLREVNEMEREIDGGACNRFSLRLSDVSLERLKREFPSSVSLLCESWRLVSAGKRREPM